MTESLDLFHAMQHMKYARGKLVAYADKRDRQRMPSEQSALDGFVQFDVDQLDAMIERTKLTLQAIKDGDL